MDQLSAIRVFCKVVELQSFTKAAQQLDLSVAMVSKQVNLLEQHLDARLLMRTTRRVSVTEAGHLYYEKCHAILAELELANALISEHSRRPSGRIRISVPMDFGTLKVAPLLADFNRRYPDIRLDLEYSDRLVALVEENFDLALRIGTLADSSLIARPLAQVTMVTCASPGYLAQHGTPTHPDHLAEHSCLLYTLSEPQWTYSHAGRTYHVRPKGIMRANTGRALALAASQGMGVIMQPHFIVDDYLDNGTLVPLLERFKLPVLTLNLVYPHRHFLPSRVKCFVDYMESCFRQAAGHSPTN
ncbi:LysR family transcriptional regulator [Zobellella endophytica]|uniref:LysR family transcriptional regulator n=1 Tax=Zobellella endophytica TaxID=2116700 RepID=A0A2P7RCZ6_9GAMM|nr:LysR family transcriptional regulator [Zobellella endophytica]PSJ48091.1 LysR family transcriptional regulator [Zobellella endophytica]